MHVGQLTLRDFRNYHHLDLAPTPGTTLLYGPNAAGKTSILEALYLLATTRSPRTSSDRELVRRGTVGQAGTPPFARVAATVQQASRSLQLEVLVQVRGEEIASTDAHGKPQGTAQKLIRVNRKPTRALDLVGHLRVVLFTPADLILVSGAPAERRRYLDITLSQLDPHYVRTLAHYMRIVQQRNSLLRAWREQRRPRRGVDDELGYWDSELTSAGGYLLAERLRAVADLNRLVGHLYCDITGSDTPLEIAYQPSLGLPDSPRSGQLAAALSDHLHAIRSDELTRGQTLVGPHRDDLRFTVDGVNLGVYGSRGQQRSIALALKLAEARLMHERSGEAPVLLLDDLLSELDQHRRRHLLAVIAQPDQQTLVTATDLSDFTAAFLQQATTLRVAAGRVYAAPSTSEHGG